MPATLSQDGQAVELNEYVGNFFAELVFAVTHSLQGVSADAARIVVTRSTDELVIEADGATIEWFMDFPPMVIGRTLDAAVQTLRGCENTTSYTLEVSR